ncbi:MAG: hypothetical protein F4Z74_11940 [Acidobacteria bacterium]|nr:hypothetical protein [Acidobacteriota bacterium]MYE43977.1 hypothetical protein [Acidobacteriota bacterium]
MTPAIDLRPDHRKVVEDILKKHLPHGVKVWVFGSRAEWTTKDSSDLDLALESDGPLDTRTVMALELAFEESLLPFNVDVVDLGSVKDGFREIVLRSRIGLSLPRDRDATNTKRGEMGFSDAFLVNPRVKLERGLEYPFVEMSDLMPGLRAAISTRRRRFTGGGSRFRSGDTLMARITPCLENGKIARYLEAGTDDVGHGSTEFIVIRGRPGVTDTEFAFYLTRSASVRDYAIAQMSGTSGRQRVPVDALSTLIVPVPSLPEQRATARVLGTLDDRIELNRRMNETLEAMARALFKSWFVDFDPVRAKMEGRDTGLPPDIADLFPDRLVEADSGQAPVGWATFVMQDLAELHKDTTDPQTLGDSDVEHFSIPAFDAGGMPTLQPGRSIRSNKTIVPTNAVLLSKLNPETSRVWIPHCPRGVPQLCSTEFLAFTPVGNVSRSLLYGLFTSRAFRSLLMGMVTGTSKSHQRVQPRALVRTTVLAGTAALFDCYDRMISRLLGSIPGRRLQTQRLGDLRDTLLPKLVAGEIRLPAALVPEAA